MLTFMYNQPLFLTSLFGLIVFSVGLFLLDKNVLTALILLILSPLVCFFVGLKLQETISAPIEQKVSTLQFLLDENKIDIKDQMSYSFSPVSKVREIMAENKNTSSEVLRTLRDDPDSEIKMKAYVNLQKRNETPVMTLSEYKEINKSFFIYIIYFSLALGAALALWISVRKNSDVAVSVCLMVLGFSTMGIAVSFLGSNDNYYVYRAEVFDAKIKNKSITRKEFLDELESLSAESANVLLSNVESLSNEQLTLVYPKAKYVILENEMKKRSLITEHEIRPEDFE